MNRTYMVVFSALIFAFLFPEEKMHRRVLGQPLRQFRPGCAGLFVS